MTTISLPSYFSHAEAQGYLENESLLQYELGSMANFVYFILDWQSMTLAMVDSQPAAIPILAQLIERGFDFDKIILTHTHYDHTAGLDEIIKKWPKVHIHVHHDDNFRLPEGLKVTFVDEKSDIYVGNLTLKVWLTPGHSAGACCYLLQSKPQILLSGDTVFIGTCGRCDLDTGNLKQMFTSIQRLKNLPTDVIVCPGHHYSRACATTIGHEIQTSPAFQARSIEELAKIP